MTSVLLSPDLPRIVTNTVILNTVTVRIVFVSSVGSVCFCLNKLFTGSTSAGGWAAAAVIGTCQQHVTFHF